MYSLSEKDSECLMNTIKERLGFCNKMVKDKEFCFLNYEKIKELKIDEILSVAGLDRDIFNYAVNKNMSDYIVEVYLIDDLLECRLKLEHHLVYVCEYIINTRDRKIYNSSERLSDLVSSVNNFASGEESLAFKKRQVQNIEDKINYVKTFNSILRDEALYSDDCLRCCEQYNKNSVSFKIKNTEKARECQLRTLSYSKGELLASIKKLESSIIECRERVVFKSAPKDTRDKVSRLLNILEQKGFSRNTEEDKYALERKLQNIFNK